jgi:hypothetical protein
MGVEKQCWSTGHTRYIADSSRAGYTLKAFISWLICWRSEVHLQWIHIDLPPCCQLKPFICHPFCAQIRYYGCIWTQTTHHTQIPADLLSVSVIHRNSSSDQAVKVLWRWFHSWMCCQALHNSHILCSFVNIKHHVNVWCADIIHSNVQVENSSRKW